MVDSVLTGTGISWPEAIMAFLLLLVKTIGRLSTLKRPVWSSMLTIALRPNPVLKKILVPPVATAVASWVKLIKPAGSSKVPWIGHGGRGISRKSCRRADACWAARQMLLRSLKIIDSEFLVRYSAQLADDGAQATCGAFTSISSRIFDTFTTTSRLPRTMIAFAR